VQTFFDKQPCYLGEEHTRFVPDLATCISQRLGKIGAVDYRLELGVLSFVRMASNVQDRICKDSLVDEHAKFEGEAEEAERARKGLHELLMALAFRSSGRHVCLENQ
jgi:hypothetical protein